jgi:hypothetical protein
MAQLLYAAMNFSDRAFAQESMIGVAAVLILLGTRFCWHAPRHRMSIEERAKDGKLTEEQARRKIRWMGWTGPAFVLLGVALLAYALMLMR